MKAVTITLLLVGLAMARFTCSSPLGVKGDGVVKTESREVPDFSKVEAAGGYEIKWTQGKPALAISTDQNLLPHIRTEVRDGALRIDSRENLRPTKGTTIAISSESLAGVELTGANTFTAGGLSIPDLTLGATGASTINVEGSVKNLAVNMTGACTLRARFLEAQTATLTLTGASTADVTVADALNASITGACSVTYSGNPKSVEKMVTGAGSIRHLQ
jgi:hypothetical protein